MKRLIQVWGILPIIILYFFFSMTYVVGKAGFAFGSPIFFISLRMLISGIVLLLFYTLAQKKRLYIKRGDWGDFLQAAIFGIALFYAVQYWVLKYIAVAKVSLICALTPFLTALLVALLDATEKITTREVLGLGIGFVGLLPIIIKDNPSENIFTGIGYFSVLEIVLLIGVVAYAYSWLPIKRLVKKGYSPIFINGFTMFFGGLILVASSFKLESWNGFIPPVNDWKQFLWYIFLIILCGTSGLLGRTVLLQYYSLTLISFVGCTNPLFAAFHAWIFLGETVSWVFIISALIVSIGLYIFYQEELRIAQ